MQSKRSMSKAPHSSCFKVILAFMLSVLGTGVMAQDIHLTQYYTNQLNLNPALGGMYDGEYRVVANYRNQWREINTPLTTTMIAADKKFHFFSDEIDAGLLVIHDEFSDFGLTVNKILLSGSYKKMFRGHELRGGIQLGVVFKNTDLKTQTFPSQWVYETGEFDQSVASGETTINESLVHFDMNLGVAWSKKLGKRTRLTSGFSIFHVNRPKDTYFSTYKERLQTRQIFHLDADVRFGNIGLEPKFIMMWTTMSQNMILGSNFKYHFQKSMVRNVYVGVMYRTRFGANRDAAAPVIGMGINRLDIGFSYDVNVSQLSAYSDTKTTFEISLVYTAPMFSPKTLSIPCDRY